MDLLAIYAAARGRIIGLVGDRSDGQLAIVVPGTPLWSARDLVSHLAGVTADTVHSNLEGAGEPEWTARQVASRRDRSVEQLLAEWEAEAPAAERLLAETDAVGFLAVDALTHEHDLRGALGVDGVSDRDAVGVMIGRVLSAALGPKLDGGGLPALRLVSPDASWVAGAGEIGATVSASAGELFRSLMGRRSEAQVRRYDWEGDPAAFLGVYSLFGPLPSDDVLEAGAV